MYAVIFEVDPKPEGKQEYLDIAGELRAELERADGFISIERFESLTNEGKMLSLSYWRDEEAIRAWRERVNHQQAQAKGRTELFNGYRIRVAQVVRDYTMDDRSEALQPPPEGP